MNSSPDPTVPAPSDEAPAGEADAEAVPAGEAPAEAPSAPRAATPRPPRPRPAPPRRGPRPPAGRPAAAPAPEPSAPVTDGPSPSGKDADGNPWGRVDEEGTVFVRTADGEHQVGQWPGGDPVEVLEHFVRKYDALAFEIELLETRLANGAVAPDDATAALKQVRGAVNGAQVVGDLASLEQRLAAITTLIAEEREKRRAERAEKLGAAAAEKERIAAEAERLATSSDWRAGADRMRALLEEWKELPRLDRAADDALWRRFSSARTTYTRRRKAHFAELNEQREGARGIKEKLVKEAEALSGSTDWGPTAGAYRDLMRRWKDAGPAPKGVDDQLWRKFRAAQDTFFGARDAATAATDAEFADNAVKKEAILAEAEALLPVTDLAAAKAAFRDLADRWDAAGKVPRERMKELEGRMRTVEQAIRGVEDDVWRRSNPEAHARAADTVAQLEALIADLQAKHDAAVAAGNDRKAAEHAAALEARQSWLTEARKALDEFSP